MCVCVCVCGRERECVCARVCVMTAAKKSSIHNASSSRVQRKETDARLHVRKARGTSALTCHLRAALHLFYHHHIIIIIIIIIIISVIIIISIIIIIIRRSHVSLLCLSSPKLRV